MNSIERFRYINCFRMRYNNNYNKNLNLSFNHYFDYTINLSHICYQFKRHILLHKRARGFVCTLGLLCFILKICPIQYSFDKTAQHRNDFVYSENLF